MGWMIPKNTLFLAAVLLIVPLATAGTPSLAVEAGNGQACVTESGSYSITVSNPGPASDTYDLNVKAPWSDSVTMSDSRVQVGPGDSEEVFMWIQVPRTASRGDHQFTVSAISSNNGKKDSVRDTIKVLSCRSVSLEADDLSHTVCRNDEAVYGFDIENDGKVEETYSITTGFGELSTERVTLGAGEDTTIELTASSNKVLERDIQVTAESTTSYAADSATVAFASEECRGVDVSIQPRSSTVCRSDNVGFTATIKNTGKIQDDYAVDFGGENRSVSLGPGTTIKLTKSVPSTSIKGLYAVTARSTNFPAVTDSATSDVKTEICSDMALRPTSILPETANRTLMELALVNNGTRANTYSFLMDGPDWMDVQPTNTTLRPGEEQPVYIYMAPDFFGDGFYTAALVAEGKGIRKTINLNVTAENGTVTVDFQETRTPTGFIPTASSSIVSIIVTALILLFGGYWFMSREGTGFALPPSSPDRRDSAGDYLNRNANTVVKAIREEGLSDEFLRTLLNEEKKNKNRQRVLNQVRRELGEL